MILPNLFIKITLFNSIPVSQFNLKSNFMKNIILISLLFLGSFVQAQSPQLNVKGKDSALVRLSQLKVSVKVVGNIAYTTTEMHFYNGTNRQMEAKNNANWGDRPPNFWERPQSSFLLPVLPATVSIRCTAPMGKRAVTFGFCLFLCLAL